MKKISICIPVLNEEDNILNAYQKIKDVFSSKLQNYDYEFIFTDNHSTDKSEQILTNLCTQDKKVKCIFLLEWNLQV